MNAISYTPRYPSWDRFRPIILKFSVALSIAVCLLVFSLETVAPVIQPIDYGPPEEKVFVMDTPPTIHKKKVIPPVKPPEPIKPKEQIPTLIKAVDNIEKTTVEEKIFIDPEVDAVSTGPVEIPDPAVAPKIEIEEPAPPDIVHHSVEQMPVFGDCSLDDFSGKELRDCSDKSLLTFIQSKLKYPSFARENGIEGTVVAQFIVDKKGVVTEVKIIRDIGGGCGNAAKKVLDLLPNWKPGKQNGRPVKVLYTVPVKFKLN